MPGQGTLQDARLRGMKTLVQYHGDAPHVHKISNLWIKDLLNAKQLKNPPKSQFGHTYSHVIDRSQETLRGYNDRGRKEHHIKTYFLSLEDMYMITDFALRSSRVEEAMEAFSCYWQISSIFLVIPIKELNLSQKFYAITVDTNLNKLIGGKWEIEYVAMNLKPFFYEYYIPVDGTDVGSGIGNMVSVGMKTMYPIEAVNYDEGIDTMMIKNNNGSKNVPWVERYERFGALELRPHMARNFFLDDC